MLKRLRIKGFKAWKDTGELRLAPLTVLFGSNSSGKSSLIQFLLMLKQTAESPDRHRVLHPGDSTTPVDLGTYHDLTFAHGPDGAIECELAWDLATALVVQDSYARTKRRGRGLRFSACVGPEEDAGGLTRVRQLEYELATDDPEQRLSVSMVPHGRDKGRYDLRAEGYRLVRRQGRKWPLPAPIRFYGFPDETTAYFQNTGFVADFSLEMERLLAGINYLGPLRKKPARTYIWSGEVPSDVGWQGERAVEALLAARDRRISAGYRKQYQPFEQVVARWLQSMGLIDHFDVRPIAEHRKEYEVRVRTPGNAHEVTLPDVGFGISQVLPVIVQCFHADYGSICLFEQPELHLHPGVQASLADLLIETIFSRENGRDRNVQLIIESHSEHLLRRLQRRIAEEELSGDDVAVYFCRPGQDGAQIEPLEIDAYGRITNWPEGFFGDVIGEVEEQTRTMIDRMMCEGGG